MRTSFSDRTGGTGPVIGGLFSVTVGFDNITAAETDTKIAIQLPAGMSMKVTDVSSFTGAVGAAGVTLNVGTTSGGTDIVNAAAVVAAAKQYTVVANTVAAGGTVFVQLVGGASTGTLALPIAVTITGYPTAAPTSLATRTITGTGV